MRAAAATALAFVLALQLGCHTVAEVWIEADGSGRGTILVSRPTSGITLDDVRRQLEKAGFTVTAASEQRAADGAAVSDDPRLRTPPEAFHATIRWDDFRTPFRRRTVTDDGVVLDFGSLDPGMSLIAHVPGTIDRSESFGRAMDSDSVSFDHGLARLRYRPGSPIMRIALIAAGAAIPLAFIGCVWWSRRTRKDATAPISPRPESQSAGVSSDSG